MITRSRYLPDSLLVAIGAADPRRQAAILRTRAWNEQRTARGLCHRCPKYAGSFWYCRPCRVEIAQLRATRGGGKTVTHSNARPAVAASRLEVYESRG